MVAAVEKASLDHMLVNETEAGCTRPSDCPSRGMVGEVCKHHGNYHDFFLVRHCDEDGNLIHLDVSMYHPLNEDC